MCHIRRHIWNNSAVEDISTRGEIQVISSVFVCVSVCECVRQPTHTLVLEWKKSSAALFFHSPALFSLRLSFFSPHYDSKAYSALPNLVAMVTVKLWSLFRFVFFSRVAARRGMSCFDGRALSEEHPSGRQNRFTGSRFKQIAALRAFYTRNDSNHSFSMRRPGRRSTQELATWQTKQQVGSK